MLELKIGKADDAIGWFEFIAAMTGALAWPIAVVIVACVFRSQIGSVLGKIRRLTWGDKSADFTEGLDKAEKLEAVLTQDVGPVENKPDAVQVGDEQHPGTPQAIDLGTPLVRPEPAEPVQADSPIVTDDRDPNRVLETRIHYRKGLVSRRGDLPSRRFLKLMDISPAAAVLDTWKEVESRLFETKIELDVPSGYQQALTRQMPTSDLARTLATYNVISSKTYVTIKALQDLRNTAAHSRDDLTKVDAVRFFNLAQEVIEELDRVNNAAARQKLDQDRED